MMVPKTCDSCMLGPWTSFVASLVGQVSLLLSYRTRHRHTYTDTQSSTNHSSDARCMSYSRLQRG